jgi:hypothetical protein
MKKLLTFVALYALMATSIAAQNQKLTSKMIYHNGPVLTGVKSIYTIWYGCWGGGAQTATLWTTVQQWPSCFHS